MAKLYVGNLQWGVTDELLKGFFEKVGHVISVNIIMDRETGRSRGFGFVEMEDGNGTEAAIQLSGTSLNGRPIAVKPAEPERRTDQTMKPITDFLADTGKIGEQIEIEYGEKRFTLTREI
jgi:RNA recognition motif-containing protein